LQSTWQLVATDARHAINPRASRLDTARS
jgi:hypothetical protein